MDGRCERHQFEAAAGLCDHCGDEFCSECLVRPFGDKKPPFCIPCTIAQSGLRSGMAKPKKQKMSRKERKELAAAGPAAVTATPIVTASAQAMMSANKRADRVEAPAAEEKSSKRGRLGRRKGNDEQEAAVPTPVAQAAPVAMAPMSPMASDDNDEAAVPHGVGMTAAGADAVDWSKPFEVSS